MICYGGVVMTAPSHRTPFEITPAIRIPGINQERKRMNKKQKLKELITDYVRKEVNYVTEVAYPDVGFGPTRHLANESGKKLNEFIDNLEIK
jgi:hypothetical protein